MGLFDDDIEDALGRGLAHGLGHIGGALIGGAIAGAISGSANNNNRNDDYDDEEEGEPKKIYVSPKGEYKVVKCPGCGHRSSIVDGDGVADRCEYCGTAIGN